MSLIKPNVTKCQKLKQKTNSTKCQKTMIEAYCDKMSKITTNVTVIRHTTKVQFDKMSKITTKAECLPKIMTKDIFCIWHFFQYTYRHIKRVMSMSHCFPCVACC